MHLNHGTRVTGTDFNIPSQNATQRISPLLLSVLVVIAAFSVFTGRAWAQTSTAERYYVGTGSVDLYGGRFLYSNRDISIGSPGSESELYLERYYGVRGYGPNPFGMTSAHNHEVRIYRYRYTEDPWGPPNYSFTYYVVIGRTVHMFDEGFGSPISYLGNEPGPHILTRSGDRGPYEFTGPGGRKIFFTELESCVPIGYPANACGVATAMVDPDGQKLEFGYDTGSTRLRYVKNSHGFSLGFNYAGNSNYEEDAAWNVIQVCAVNLATHEISAAAPCPAGVRSAWYTPQSNLSGINGISAFTDPDGKTTNYTYSQIVPNIETIKSPASASPDVTVTYSAVTNRVTQLSYADGSSTSYTYENTYPVNYEISANYWTDVTTSSGTTRHHFLSGAFYGHSSEPPLPVMITDPIGRVSKFQHSGAQPYLVLLPEGNETRYAYDTRGNRIETRQVAKPGSGQADLVSTAAYTSTCANLVICDKPTSATDALGNSTSFTYDAVHGGTLTETSPAVNGIQPVKRYSYVQRAAWLKSGSGYVQSASTVWLVAEERTCRSTATVGNACAGGSADEVIKSYDYGPDSGPNNLLLRGAAVSADGVTLRTCFGYNAVGWKISETKPRAALAACP